jgi:hypothetical protein
MAIRGTSTMTKDLTPSFLQALDHRAGWVPDKLATDLHALSSTVGARFEWGWDEGERWMRVESTDGRPLVLVWTLAPLVIATSHAVPLISGLLEQYQETLEVVDDWEVPVFALDPEAVEAAGAIAFWRTDPDAISSSRFSILDLVFATE